MRSRHADDFNHDDDADGYDLEVLDDRDPIRTGYSEALGWIAERGGRALGDRRATVLELGSGTGNLTVRLALSEPPPVRLVCVDISSKMTTIARAKLAERAPATAGVVEWQRLDVLEYFDHPGPRFDVIASSYTLHHLTATEKQMLLEAATARLEPGGRLVVADLGFERAEARRSAVARWRRTGERELVQTVEEEFFWDLSEARRWLEALGLTVAIARFSMLSWGIDAIKQEARS